MGILQNSITCLEPSSNITEYEFDILLMKFGSLISMLFNKKITATNLLYLIIENEDYFTIFKNVSEIDDERTLLYNFLHRYPKLCKSASILNKVKIIQNDNERKKYL